MANIIPSIGADIEPVYNAGPGEPLPDPEPEPEVQPIADIHENNLQNYLRANYEIDRITKQFTKCFSQIIDDAIAFRQPGVNYGIISGLNGTMGSDTKVNLYKILFVENFNDFVHKIIQNYKNDSAYFTMLRDSLPIFEQINTNLLDIVFVNNLYLVDDGSVHHRSHLYLNKIYTIAFENCLSELLGSCQTGAWTNQNLPQVDALKYDFSISNFFLSELITSFPTSGSTFLFNKIDMNYPGGIIKNNYIPLIPINNVAGQDLVKPDFRFFIRYFQCFVDFVRQLVAINFNVGPQLGGKRIKTKRHQRKNKIIKRRRYKTRKMSYKFKCIK